MVDLVGWLYFFIEAAVDLDIGKAIGLAIGGAILMGTDVAINFFRLFLW